MNEPATITFESYRALLRSLYIDTGDGVLFMGRDGVIMEANDRVGDIWGTDRLDLLGMDCRRLLAAADRRHIDRALAELKADECFSVEANGVSGDGKTIPLDMTVKRLRQGDPDLLCVVVKDLSEYHLLRRQLHQEKTNRREMYVTLRNVMKAFEKEKSGFEGNISYKIEALVLPALHKIEREPSADLRNTYVALLREQLIHLTKGFGHELDARFLRLTRTELKICRLIQSGHSTKDIAAEMNLSVETVQSHRKNIRQKLGIKGRKIGLHAALSAESLLKPRAV
jgi:PAS domain S-box-containing protein